MRLAVWSSARLLLLVLCLVVCTLCLTLLAIFLPHAADAGLSPWDSDLLLVELAALASAVAALRLWTLPKTPAWRRTALIVVFALAALPLIRLAWFDANYFHPRLEESRSRTWSQAEQEAYADPRVAKLIDAFLGENLDSIVIRHILLSPSSERGPGRYGGLRWLPAQLASAVLLRVHCDRDELRRFYATHAYEGRYGHGFRAAALGMFQKQPKDLTTNQLAKVVAYTWGPGLLEKRPELLARRASMLEAKLAESER